ncbi:MAG: hypothetical protein JWN73_235 [Betaproteobacteria bacterium]|nr:hypothetical protein [Betaproteobacteria bacterium]
MQATSKFTLRNALILTALVVPGGCVALLAIALVRGAANMCANKTVEETASPDGQNRAVVFERNCGATTGFSAQVTILSKNETPGRDASGRFTTDTGHGAPAGGGGPQVRVRWRSAGRLETATTSAPACSAPKRDFAASSRTMSSFRRRKIETTSFGVEGLTRVATRP